MLYIGNMFPDAPIYGIGFSLGTGMLTKYLGKSAFVSPFLPNDFDLLVLCTPAVEADRTAMKSGVVLGCPWDLMLYATSS
jgi:predicted alpha/beta-fold hydrolase